MANNQQLASDNFGSGSLAAGWSAITGMSTCQVVVGTPNVTEPNALSVEAGQKWTGLVWPNDQTSEATTNITGEAQTHFKLWTRLQAASLSGYVVDIDNMGGNRVAIYRYDSGTPTQLRSFFTSVPAYVSGDVWSFQSAGAIHSVYLNGVRIYYAADATYTSGAPGFSQFTTVNLTHTKCLSWRGYNSVQQDGIWKKQGVVIPAIAADLASTGWGVLPNSAVLYEGGAQILSGTVFKMWFGAGNNTTGNIYYAESTDGISWTRRGAAVIVGYMIPTILKVASTYYLYAQASASQGMSNFQVFTSSDGITWGAAHDTGLGLGVASSWDDTNVYIFQPVTGGPTWKGLYSGTHNAANQNYSIGYATSVDGLNWTKYVSNPVLGPNSSGGGVLNSQAIANISGTYYMWCEGTSAGQSAIQTDLNPTQCVRYQSTDLINWTNPTNSVHNSQMYEDVNGDISATGMIGQCIPAAIIDVSGKAYLYMNSSAANGGIGNGFPSFYQVTLAIAPAPIAQIITNNEDAAQQVASDNFTSGLGDLSANWSTPIGSTKLQIVAGNLVEASALTTVCAMRYTGASFNADQYSEITIHASTGTGPNVEPFVRCQANGDQYNVFVATNTGARVTTLQINKSIGGVGTAIGPNVGITTAVGDKIRLTVTTGSDGNPILSVYQNGFLMLQSEDYSNAIPSSGAPGMAINVTGALTNAQISGWAGGNAGVIPSYSGGGGDLGPSYDFRIRI